MVQWGYPPDPAAMNGGAMLDRMLRAAFLQPRAYQEAERGGFALALQALLVVAVAGALAGVGAGLGDDVFRDGFIGGAVSVVAGWLLWSICIVFVGTRVFSAQTTLAETARTVGFAYTPAGLLVLVFIPILGPILAVVVTIWRLLAVYIALNVALDLNPIYTLLTVVISFVPAVVLGLIVGLFIDVRYI